MEEAKEIAISSLQQGDIILFSPDESDTLSKAIAWITDSEVTHTAMIYYTNDEVAEETLHGLVLTPTQTRIDSQRTAFVLRLKQGAQEIDMKKVVDIAAQYVNSDQPYATADLLFIAIYFLFEKCSKDTRVNAAIAKIIKLAMEVLIDITNEKLYPGKDPMHCSQFVYHCYKEAGPEYEIILKKDTAAINTYGLLQNIKGQDLDCDLSYEEIRKEIIEQRQQETNLKQSNSQTKNIEVQKAVEELVAALKADKMNKANKIKPTLETIALDKDFVNLIHRFCILLTKSDSLKEAMKKLDELREFFVTPGDLLTHTENLVQIGVLKKN